MSDERHVCNKEHPMPPGSDGKWLHVDAVRVSLGLGKVAGKYRQYECALCNWTFIVNMENVQKNRDLPNEV